MSQDPNENLLNQLNPSNPINQMLIRNSENLDRVLETRRNLRNQLETTRCNYLLSPNRFCAQRKTTDSDYCVHHSNEFNGVNYGMASRLPITPLPRLIGRARAPVPRRRVLSLPDLDVSSTSDLTSSLEMNSSSLNQNLDVSSISSFTSVSSSNPNISVEIIDEEDEDIIDENEQIIIRTNEILENINRTFRRNNITRHINDNQSLDPNLNPNLNFRRRRNLSTELFAFPHSLQRNVGIPTDIPVIPVLGVSSRASLGVSSRAALGVSSRASYSQVLASLGVSSRAALGVSSRASYSQVLGVSSPEINLFNLISRRRPLDNLSELKKQKSKNGKCSLCQKTVSHPKVILNCDHKYHLKCYMILNTDSDNKYDIMEKCVECEKPIDLNLPETKDCSICLEKLIDDDIEIELPCKHRFHIYCIQRWVNINKNCPLCRKTF